MYSLAGIQAIIEKKIKEIPLIREPRELYGPIEYIMSLGGKRLRPALVLMSCNIFSENVDQAVLPAIGLELFHNFTLIHDDIMDKAPIRRGQPTVHEKWDDNTAILSGDAMVFLANQYISATGTKYLEDVLSIYNFAALQVCEGQQLDMNFETTELVSEQEYLYMISLKTSALLAACLKIGALTGGADKNHAEKLYRFGHNIGLAFQLQDDLLDVYGNAETFGKKPGRDIVSNKKTYLLVTALNSADDNIGKSLRKKLHKKNFREEEKINNVKKIYNQLGIKELTENIINEYFNLAMTELDRLQVEQTRLSELKTLVIKLLNRQS